MIRISPIHPALLALTLGMTGCASNRIVLPDGYDVKQPIMDVEPSDRAVADLAQAAKLYEHQDQNPTNSAFKDMTLKSCLIRAVQYERTLRERTYAAQRAGLALPIAQRELYAPFIDADYTVLEEDDFGVGKVSVTGRYAGFEIEPFVRFEHEEEDFGVPNDDFSSSYGVAVSRNVFRIRYEDLRQHLPLTRANMDFHIAINDRLLELRRLYLRVVELFYEIQRLRERISVRENRVEDAEKFLSDVKAKVQAGFSAAVEEINARINLNQAKSDLVREQTTHLNAIDRLLDLMGADLSLMPTFVEEDLGEIPAIDVDLEAEIELTRQYHETVLNQMLTMEVQRQEYRISTEEVRPDLDAVFSAAEGFDGNNDDDELRVNFNLSMPLDNFSAERARLSQNRFRMLELATELDGIRSDLERRLRLHYRTIGKIYTTVELAEIRLEEELQKLRAFSDSYERVGVPDVLEVTRAKQAADQAEVDLLDAQINRIVEEARYWAIVPTTPGDSVKSDLPDVP